VVAFQAFIIFGNLFMGVRIMLYGRPVKTEVVAIGTTAHYKK
jgi:hypothetical protein